MIKFKKTAKYFCLIIVSLLVFPVLMSSLQNTYASGDENQKTTSKGNTNYISEEISANASLKEHVITASELTALKNNVGVYQEGVNYSQIVSGHGTGLKPPTAAEWNTISQSTYVVDSVSYVNTPFSVDNSKSPYFPPIGNQGTQGSCVAWSIGYYMATFQAAKEHGWNLTGATWSSGQPATSYQNKIISPAFVYNLINGGTDNGATYTNAIQLVCFIGASSWKTMPFNQTDYVSWPSVAAWTEAPANRGNSSGYQQMLLTDDADINNLKNWLASGHLATTGVDSDQFINLTDNDVWTLDNYNSPNSQHAGTIVGYDDNFAYNESGQVHYGAFKFANSWGVGGWEKVNDGFYWVSYEAMKQRIHWCCYFFDQSNYQPELLATFNVNDTVRGNCVLTVGLGNPNHPIITKCLNDYVSGGNHPFSSNNVVMDITEFKDHMPSQINQLFFLKATENGENQTGTITYFAVGNASISNISYSVPNYPSATYLNLTYNQVNPAISISSLSGVAGSEMTINGTGFTENNNVSISYLNPITSTWTALSRNVTTNSTYQFNYLFNAPDLMQSGPSGDNPAANYNLTFQAKDNYYGFRVNTTVPFMEWQRGLIQVGNSTAEGLFGNNTSLSSDTILQDNSFLVISGKWFYPGSITIFFDDSSDLGTFQVDNEGFFNETITVPPSRSNGQHSIVITDATTQFVFSIAVANPEPSPTPKPVPSPSTPPAPSPMLPLPTHKPWPTPTTEPSPTQSSQTTTDISPTQSPPPSTDPSSTPTPTPYSSSTPPVETTSPTSQPSVQQAPELNIQTVSVLLAMVTLAVAVKYRKNARK